MAWNLHAIEQTQLRRQHRVDCVGRLGFDFHTGSRLPALRRRGLVAGFASQLIAAFQSWALSATAAAPRSSARSAANCLDRAALFDRVWRVLERASGTRGRARGAPSRARRRARASGRRAATGRPSGRGARVPRCLVMIWKRASRSRGGSRPPPWAPARGDEARRFERTARVLDFGSGSGSGAARPTASRTLCVVDFCLGGGIFCAVDVANQGRAAAPWPRRRATAGEEAPAGRRGRGAAAEDVVVGERARRPRARRRRLRGALAPEEQAEAVLAASRRRRLLRVGRLVFTKKGAG